MGPKVYKLLDILRKKRQNFASYKEIKDFFDKHFVARKDIVHARAKFILRYQKEGESTQDYVSDLIFLARNCDSRIFEDELTRDCLVVGIEISN
ncbi:hypothetical protein JTB14_017602 [Gonioctena quinquepunctata]|nr:hypothetical protein JTB14_017602 [Gonioctena quinquepunctata]